MANYNLPGVYTFYKERGLMAAPSATERVTDEILILGTATDGPKNMPVRVERPQDAENLFGSYENVTNGSALLVPAFCEAYAAGARNIYLMRITGQDAKLEIAGLMTIYGTYPGAKYNETYMVKVDSVKKEVTIWNKVLTGAETSEDLAGLKPEQYEVFVIDEKMTPEKLAQAIMAKTGLRVELEDAASFDALVDLEAPLAGGKDEAEVVEGTATYDQIALGTYSTPSIEGEGYRKELQAAYELLVDYSVKTVIPLGVHVGFNGDMTPTYDKTDAEALANFCYTAAQRNNDVMGTISVKPFAGDTLAEVKDEVDKLKGPDVVNEFVADDGTDIGKYITIVVAEGIFTDRNIGIYNNTLAATYAGFVSTLPIQSGSTNKVLPGVGGLRYNLSPAQAEALRKKKFTVIRNKFNRGITVVEGLVASLPTSDFQSQSTVRVVHGVMDAIRQVTDPFIGEPLDIPHINSLENAINGRLDQFVAEGAITSASFQILFPQNAAVLGDVRIDLELGIASELRRILVTVSRSLPNLERR